MKKRGLGRGLDVLLSQTKLNELAPKIQEEENRVLSVAIDLLVVGEYQPRRFFAKEALELLAESIRSQGIIQPIVVRKIDRDNKQKYEILAGERRWRASQMIGLKEVPVILKKLSDQDALVVALIENIQREDLNPIETAEAVQRLINEFELTHSEAGELIGRSRSTVTNILRLLELSSYVQELLLNNEIDMGHARAMLSLPTLQQNKIADMVVQKKLTVRETEALVRNQDSPEERKKNPYKTIARDQDVMSLEKNISEYLGAVTLIKEKGRGKGEVLIKYNSLEELSGILVKMRGDE